MKIAIVKLTAMGDIIHAAVVVQFIKARFPESRIEWICEEIFAPILAYSPQIDAVHTVNLKAFKKHRSPSMFKALYRHLKTLGPYDYIFDLQGLIKSAIVARVLGKNVYGFDRHSLREKAASWFYRHKYAIPYEQNVVWRNLELIQKGLGFEISQEEVEHKLPFLFSPMHDAVSAYDVVVFVGASWPSKIYPAAQMSEVIDGIGKQALLVWGNESEHEMAKEIAQQSDYATVSTPLSLEALIAVMDKSRVVIGGDTGPVHMAWALNRPSVMIFGPTPWFRNTLTTPQNRTVHTGKTIDPKKLDKQDMAIASILPSAVIEVVMDVLKTSE